MSKNKNILYILIALIVFTQPILAFCEPTNIEPPPATITEQNPSTPIPSLPSTPYKKNNSTNNSSTKNISPQKTENIVGTQTIDPSNKEDSTKSKTTDNFEEKNGSTINSSDKYGPKQMEPSKKDINLPNVKESEINLPEVIASNDKKDNSGILAGIVAWGCIACGVIIILVVLISGYKSSQEDKIQKVSPLKKRNKKHKHLLQDKYYSDKY